MPNIKITVAGKIATNTTPGVVIVCGNKDYTATFDLDDEWAAETARTARFVYYKNGMRLFKDVQFTGDTVAVPALSGIDYVMVGIYAGDLHTTTPAQVLCDRSILCGDAVEQINDENRAGLQAQIGDLSKLQATDKANLVAAINEALAAGATPEQIAVAVAAYLDENPVTPGATPEQAAQIQANKTAIEQLQQSGDAGGTAVASVEPAEDDIPKVFIDGVIPTTKDDALAEMRYYSKTESFHAYILIKCQGTSSMDYPKKNFTVKLYSDEARETKIRKVFRDWGIASHKFVLKANYIDHSHARNIICANLWTEVVASRPDYDTLPEELRTSPKNGAIDGFPIRVFTNGIYQGLYTWNIGKDDWMWNMDEDNPNHVLLCAESNTAGTYAETPCNFRALWSGQDEVNWSVEVGTNSDAVKTSLNNLIQFVMDNDGDAFRAGIGNHLDVQSAIDYYLHQYVICGLDGLAKNMLLATYDGTKWICGAYDMDSTFGLWWNGTSFVSAEYACPEEYQEQYSLLWERMETNFTDELKARYNELRKTVYSYGNMISKFEWFTDKIGKDLYAEDLTVYPGIPSGSSNNIKQLRTYILNRLEYVDGEINNDYVPMPCTGISLSENTLTFTGNGTANLTATVTPDGCTDSVTWESDNEAVATVYGGQVTAVGNGECTITAKCGEYSATCAVTVSGMSYAFTNCVHDFDGKAVMTVSNGNHVNVTSNDNLGAIWVNMSNANRNTTFISSGSNAATDGLSPMFALKNGDVVKMRATFTEQTTYLGKSYSFSVPAISGDILKGNTEVGTVEITKTITEDTNVLAFNIWVASGAIAGDVLDFDVEFYVNDVRYI